MPFKILVIFLCFISLNADQKEITQKISQNKTALESKKEKRSTNQSKTSRNRESHQQTKRRIRNFGKYHPRKRKKHLQK